ncbi:MAG: two-component system response regulator [Thermoplasmata archaeon]|nr:MAG: two-component system response regulator [Thermoplasmata archaeon]
MNSVKILIIDDDEDLIVSTKILLNGNGIEVIGAINGEEGIKKALEEKPDYIFIDIDMPGMDGWETLKKIKSHEELKNIPVAMLTATSLSDSIDREEIEGINDYITKPFTREDIIECLRQVYDF